MAPTELLAIQHYEQLRDLLEKMEGVSSKPTIGLLTGSTPTKQSRMIRQVSLAANKSLYNTIQFAFPIAGN